MQRKQAPRTQRPKEFYDDLIHAIELWPLVSFCGIRVREPDQQFTPEHLFPQLVLQWAIEEKQLDGVVFQSTRVDHPTHKSLLELPSFAIPAKKIATSGFCPNLSDKFRLTRPIGWEALLAQRHGREGPFRFHTRNQGFALEVSPEFVARYEDSTFALVDDTLMKKCKALLPNEDSAAV
ncbi:MAG: hypothetical protein AAFU85_28590 [Planctomycetota bacterium]